MEVIIKGDAKEIAALIAAIQERQEENKVMELGAGASVVLNGR